MFKTLRKMQFSIKNFSKISGIPPVKTFKKYV